MVYYPEGRLLEAEENAAVVSDIGGLKKAMERGSILEARAVMCNAEHDLIVDIPGIEAMIPRAEGALGIAEGSVRDIAILSRVGKPVCFTVTAVDESGEKPACTLSRVAAQKRCMEEYISALHNGDIIPATVTHLEPFGAFVDIGCGISSLIPIDAISVSRISHPADRFRKGQHIRAVVRGIDGSGRVYLTHKELLGTWEENAARFSPGEAVRGIVRSVESYGVFIELAPNLAGLSEPREGLSPGMTVSVFIKSVKPEKMKLKLAVIDTCAGHRAGEFAAPPPEYFIKERHIDLWQYSPECCQKNVSTDFTTNVIPVR